VCIWNKPHSYKNFWSCYCKSSFLRIWTLFLFSGGKVSLFFLLPSYRVFSRAPGKRQGAIGGLPNLSPKCFLTSGKSSTAWQGVAESRRTRGTRGSSSPGIRHLHRNRDRPKLGWDPFCRWAWLGGTLGRARKGCRELDTSPAEVLLGQGLTASGSLNGVLSHGRGMSYLCVSKPREVWEIHVAQVACKDLALLG